MKKATMQVDATTSIAEQIAASEKMRDTLINMHFQKQMSTNLMKLQEQFSTSYNLWQKSVSEWAHLTEMTLTIMNLSEQTLRLKNMLAFREKSKDQVKLIIKQFDQMFLLVPQLSSTITNVNENFANNNQGVSKLLEQLDETLDAMDPVTYDFDGAVVRVEKLKKYLDTINMENSKAIEKLPVLSHCVLRNNANKVYNLMLETLNNISDQENDSPVKNEI